MAAARQLRTGRRSAVPKSPQRIAEGRPGAVTGVTGARFGHAVSEATLASTGDRSPIEQRGYRSIDYREEFVRVKQNRYGPVDAAMFHSRRTLSPQSPWTTASPRTSATQRFASFWSFSNNETISSSRRWPMTWQKYVKVNA